MALMQLERILHSQGFGSRKECRRLIRSGAVSIGGEPCTDPFAEVDPLSTDGSAGLEFAVAGQRWHYRHRCYLMLHKPVGHECSHRPSHHPSVFNLLPPPLIQRGVQAVGRLDQDTSGLLLLSDDGQFIHRWSSGRKQIPKTYQVELSEVAAADLATHMCAGVQLHREQHLVAALACRLTAECSLELCIGEGRYHQVKRMIAAAGNHVAALHRTQIGGLQLDPDLEPGQWRWLEAEDLAALARF